MTKTAALIIARLGSTRVPKKHVLKINGVPMILYLIERVKRSEYLDDIIVCTSTDKSDDELCELCLANGINFGRGSLENVMERICSVAKQYNVDCIVEILGDNPLIQLDIVDHAIEAFKCKNVDYCANYSNDYKHKLKIAKFPIGIRAQVYKYSDALRYSEEGLSKQEHHSSFLFSNPDRFNTFFFGAENQWSNLNRPNYNLSVNYPENFKFVEQMFSLFGNDVALSKIIAMLDSNTTYRKMIKQSV